VLLTPLLDRFAHWHALRTALQVVTFLSLVWALVIVR